MDNINWFLWKCTIWHLSLTIVAGQRDEYWTTRGREEEKCGIKKERIVYPYWFPKVIVPYVECCNENWPRAMLVFSDCHAPGPYFRFVLATVRHLATQTRNVANVVAKAFSRLPFSLWIIRFQRGLHSFSISPITVTDMWPRHTHTPLADLTLCLATFERVVQ